MLLAGWLAVWLVDWLAATFTILFQKLLIVCVVVVNASTDDCVMCLICIKRCVARTIMEWYRFYLRFDNRAPIQVRIKVVYMRSRAPCVCMYLCMRNAHTIWMCMSMCMCMCLCLCLFVCFVYVSTWMTTATELRIKRQENIYIYIIHIFTILCTIFDDAKWVSEWTRVCAFSNFCFGILSLETFRISYTHSTFSVSVVRIDSD